MKIASLPLHRRAVISLIGGAAATWPTATHAQQPARTIGFLSSGSPEPFASRLRAFRQGLKEGGLVEGENVTVVYRWAEGQNERLPAMAEELVRRQVDLITALGSVAALSAKAASAKSASTKSASTKSASTKSAASSVPVAFAVDDDPVRLGLVASLSRPGGNLTGLNFVTNELAAKRLDLLHEMVPSAKRIAVLVNPTYPSADGTLREVAVAAEALGVKIVPLNAATSSEINGVFSGFTRDRPDALFVGGDPFFTTRRVQLVNLASRHAMPTSFVTREFTDIGALMSYGTNITAAWRQLGTYVSRLVKGAKPGDLPVEQVSKFELVVNAETARMLGLTVPDKLLATADEVIE
jgi:putative ABC transport system substrate-binding protein